VVEWHVDIKYISVDRMVDCRGSALHHIAAH
jgi:hypothetical protein